MSNLILTSLVWKLLQIWDVGLRDRKYLKNDKWYKHEMFQKKPLSNRNIL